MFQDVKGYRAAKPDKSLSQFLRELPDFIWQTPMDIVRTAATAGYKNSVYSILATLNKMRHRGQIDWQYVGDNTERVQYKGKS